MGKPVRKRPSSAPCMARAIPRGQAAQGSRFHRDDLAMQGAFYEASHQASPGGCASYLYGPTSASSTRQAEVKRTAPTTPSVTTSTSELATAIWKLQLSKRGGPLEYESPVFSSEIARMRGVAARATSRSSSQDSNEMRSALVPEALELKVQ